MNFDEILLWSNGSALHSRILEDLRSAPRVSRRCLWRGTINCIMQGYGTSGEAKHIARERQVPNIDERPLLPDSNDRGVPEVKKSDSWTSAVKESVKRKLVFWKDRILTLLKSFILSGCIDCQFVRLRWLVFWQRSLQGNGTIWRIRGFLVSIGWHDEQTAAKSWFLDESPYSIVWYYTIFCCGAAVLLPYSPFCLAVGYIFGVGQGVLIQMGAILLSSATCFAFGRYAFKDSVSIWKYTIFYAFGWSKFSQVQKWLSSHKIWMTLLRLIAKDWKEAGKVNLLMCFMPVPYGAHIYLFAISSVPFEQFIAFAMIGMMPYTFLGM
jgi:uncharacterized membrane protein YdjX (TVP38/TMEM64 family)